jgi:hypothetical protein
LFDRAGKWPAANLAALVLGSRAPLIQQIGPALFRFQQALLFPPLGDLPVVSAQ